MAKVYIVQEPLRRDPSSGQMVPMFDMRSVVEYGDPVICLKSGRVALSPAPTMQALRDTLREFGDDDYLVAVGDPSAIAMAAAIVADVNRGQFRLLKWDRFARRYLEVRVNIHGGLN